MEMFVPDPEVVKKILYRVTNPRNKAMIMIAIETGASASEIYRLTWKDLNLQKKTLTIRGVKGHKTKSYQISNELINLLMMIPKEGERIFTIKNPRHKSEPLETCFNREEE